MLSAVNEGVVNLQMLVILGKPCLPWLSNWAAEECVRSDERGGDEYRSSVGGFRDPNDLQLPGSMHFESAL